MSERLEEIKEKLDFHIDWASNTHYAEISEDELKEYRQFIIEQAEQVEAMQKLVNYHQQKQKEAEDENEPYRHQNKRYREALKFYADEDNYDHDVVEMIDGVYGVSNCEILNDEGETAIEALERESE